MIAPKCQVAGERGLQMGIVSATKSDMVMGWMVFPQNIYSSPNFLVPVNVSLFENRGFADVIRRDEIILV